MCAAVTWFEESPRSQTAYFSSLVWSLNVKRANPLPGLDAAGTSLVPSISTSNVTAAASTPVADDRTPLMPNTRPTASTAPATNPLPRLTEILSKCSIFFLLLIDAKSGGLVRRGQAGHRPDDAPT